MKKTTQLRGLPAIALAFISLTPKAVLSETLVSGVVTDYAGKEVVHASIEVLPRSDENKDGTVGNRPNPWIEADSNGRFKIRLPAGRYKILAKDEADGHPDPVFLLNSDPTANFPEILVQHENISDVHVALGKRGGILDGEVVDQPGLPIHGCKVTIRDARNQDAYVNVFSDANGRFRFTVPSKPLLISATASNYKPSSFEGGTELTLSEGEVRRILIRLQHE